MVVNLIGSIAEFRRIINIRIPLISQGYVFRSEDKYNKKKMSYMFYFNNKRHRLSWTFSNEVRINSYFVTLDFRVTPFSFRIVYQGLLSGTSIPEKFLELMHDTEVYFGDREIPKKKEEGEKYEKGK